MKQSIAIIGAGASGLVAGKVFLADGFDVTLFERDRELGGTWTEAMIYLDLHTQQPGGTMAFSDLPDDTGKTTFSRPIRSRSMLCLKSMARGKRPMRI